MAIETGIGEYDSGGLTLPGPGRAELLRGVFSQEEIKQIHKDFTAAAGTHVPRRPWSNKKPGDPRQAVALEKLVEDLEKDKLDGAATCIRRLGYIASSDEWQPTHCLIDWPESRPASMPHRDKLLAGAAMTFVVVVEKVTYHYNGRLTRLINWHTGYDTADAGPGDVLAINNLDTSRLPPHAGSEAAGVRYPLDFIKT